MFWPAFASLAWSQGWRDGVANRNVRPGDADYPVKNPHPTRFINLHGTLDPALNLSFRVVWTASPVNANAAPIRECRYVTNETAGAADFLSVDLPLAVKTSGEQVELLFPADGMLEGRCKWRLFKIYLATGADPSQEIASLIQTNTDGSHLGSDPNGRIELRCGIKPSFSQFACTPGPDDRKTSVLIGLLWWRPNTPAGTTDLEIHVRKGSCLRGTCTPQELSAP